MKLHIFNPDYDVTLAFNVDAFTAPHAIRELRTDLDYLPALWTGDGDTVLVDDVSAALESACRFGGLVHDVLFISYVDLCRVLIDFSAMKVEPWGWNRALCYYLASSNVTLRQTVPMAK